MSVIAAWISDVKRKAEFLVLQYERRGRLVPIAVLLLDVERDRLHLQARLDIDSVCDAADAEIVRAFLAELEADTPHQGGCARVAHLEDTLSNAIRITERRPVEIESIRAALQDLVDRHMNPKY